MTDKHIPASKLLALQRWDKYRNLDPRGEFVNFADLHALIDAEPESNLIADMQATIDRLTEALRPLANMADHFPTEKKFGNRPTSGNIYEFNDSAGCHGITVEDCHSAKALIAEIEAGK